MNKEVRKVFKETTREFLMKMGHPNVNVVKKLEEAPPQVSILDLVLALKAHR